MMTIAYRSTFSLFYALSILLAEPNMADGLACVIDTQGADTLPPSSTWCCEDR